VAKSVVKSREYPLIDATHPLPTANSCTLVGLFWALLWLQSFSGWWLFSTPSEKDARQNGFICPKVRGENYKNMKPPPSNDIKQQSSGWC